MTTVLLVDDDSEFVELLRGYLQRDGFDVLAANDGETGLELALTARGDITVLDVMMPRMSGIEVLRRLRMQNTSPVLMLTAKDDDMDRVLGLELGADDFVSKPCSPREIAARLRAILRRTSSSSAVTDVRALVVGDLELWPKERRAAWCDRPLLLTSTEFNLLEVLARSAGKVVSKNELSEHGLGRPLERYDRSIDVHLSSIRHKLGKLPDGRSCIQTIFRRGYQLVDPIAN